MKNNTINFNDTVKLDELNRCISNKISSKIKNTKEKFKSYINGRIKYIKEKYSENNELIYRTFYNKSKNNNEVVYTEVFKSDYLPLNYGFTSEIIKGDASNLNLEKPIEEDDILAYRYYQNKFEYKNGNYFTIIKNPNYNEDINEQKYIIADNCGGKLSGEECKNLIINLLKNQFENKMGFEIDSNYMLNNAFITSLQEEFKNHNSIKLYNINLRNSSRKYPIIDFKNINLSKDKISIIPILTDGHAVVLLYNPSDKKFHLFDSSGAFLKNEDRMKKIFGNNYKKFLSKKNYVDINNIQINGSCSFWSNTFIKKLLEDNKGKEYNGNFFKKNITDKFENCSMQLELCNEITRLFDKKEFIKIFGDGKQIFDKINNDYILKEEIKNQYYIFKIDNNYYGIDKEFYNNRFFNINNLIKIKEIEKLECINDKLNSLENKEKLINKLENRILVQTEIEKNQDKFAEIEDNIDTLKNKCRLEIIIVNEIIKDILAKKEKNNKTKNSIEILMEKIEHSNKKINEVPDKTNIVKRLYKSKNIKPDVNKNTKIINYLKDSNLKLEENLKKIENFKKRIEEISKEIPNFEIKFREYIDEYKKQEKLLNQDFNREYKNVLENLKTICKEIENNENFKKIDKLIKDINSNYQNLLKEDSTEMEDSIKNDFNERDEGIKKECKNIEESIESYDKIITELNSNFNTNYILLEDIEKINKNVKI